MKKLFATLLVLVIASTLFATVGPNNPTFTLNAQVDGIFFHGFTTNEYTNSDALLGVKDKETWNAINKVDLTTNTDQPIGYYAFYSTNLAQTTISFTVEPLSAEVLNDIYYVPYTLKYSEGAGNKSVRIKNTEIPAVAVASKKDPGSVTKNVLSTKVNSTGLRYQVLNLSVEFAGKENVSFGLPQVNGENTYQGTIVAKVVAD